MSYEPWIMNYKIWTQNYERKLTLQTAPDSSKFDVIVDSLFIGTANSSVIRNYPNFKLLS